MPRWQLQSLRLTWCRQGGHAQRGSVVNALMRVLRLSALVRQRPGDCGGHLLIWSWAATQPCASCLRVPTSQPHRFRNIRIAGGLGNKRVTCAAHLLSRC